MSLKYNNPEISSTFKFRTYTIFITCDNNSHFAKIPKCVDYIEILGNFKSVICS